MATKKPQNKCSDNVDPVIGLKFYTTLVDIKSNENSSEPLTILPENVAVDDLYEEDVIYELVVTRRVELCKKFV